MNPIEQEVILNRDVPEGGRIVAHMVPTRAFRVIELAGAMIYRVEQLDAGQWKWRTISTHVGDEEHESFHIAVQEGVAKQEEFKKKIVKAKLAQKQAQRTAEAELQNGHPFTRH